MPVALAAALVVIGEAPRAQSTADWLERPRVSDVTAAYPRRAQMQGLGGAAELECRLSEKAALRDCRVFAEAPLGQGFGAAALTMASKFRLRIPDKGAFDPAAAVYIPIRFRISGGPYPVEQVIVSPRFASAPSFEEVAAAYPRGARDRNGWAILGCRVEPGGGLAACKTLKESAAGQGFGEAALSLTSRFRVDFGARQLWPGNNFVYKRHLQGPYQRCISGAPHR
jgi:TonB family protein